MTPTWKEYMAATTARYEHLPNFITNVGDRATPERRRWRVYCSQFASCKWSGYRRASTREEATTKPCPQCGKQVTT